MIPGLLRIAGLCLFLALVPEVRAQKGFTQMQNTTALESALTKSAATTQSISSDFVQVKHMKMLSETVNSKGKFYFKQKDKVRIEYQSPFQYLLVMNGGQVLVKEGDKVNRINTRNSKTMQSVNKVMMDCMRGTVFQNSDFEVKALSSDHQYLLVLTPANNAMKSLFAAIHVYINKKDNTVSKLEMKENGGDYTDMSFTNKQNNIPLSDALFSVR